MLLIYGVDNEWSPWERQKAMRQGRRLRIAMARQGHAVKVLEIRGGDVAEALACHDPEEVLVFNWCEGIPGRTNSEAEVVDILERMKFVYTGASSEAIRLSYDKRKVSELLAANGVPVPRWSVFTSTDSNNWNLFPAIVKPAHEHSSVGVDRGSVVLDRTELLARVELVLSEYGQPALVEDFIDGREFHVALWGNDTVEMLPPAEMDFSAFRDVHDRLCSYDSKFNPRSRAYRGIKSRIPARLTPEERAELERVCRDAYRVVGCRDYGRIDVRQRGSGMYVLDVNPNADISADASIALAAQKAGYCYGKLGSRVIDFACERNSWPRALEA